LSEEIFDMGDKILSLVELPIYAVPLEDDFDLLLILSIVSVIDDCT
jgi:hypothetical protein